jgi:hypothetical protein
VGLGFLVTLIEIEHARRDHVRPRQLQCVFAGLEQADRPPLVGQVSL